MPDPAPRGNALLRAALLGAAGADLLFAAAVLIDWRGILPALGIPLPASPIFVQLAALMTAGLALTFLFAGVWPLRSRATIGIAALVRAADAILLSSFVARRLLPAWVAVLAAAEVILAVLHFIYWRRLTKDGGVE